MNSSGTTRRGFLWGSAMAAGGAVLTGCSSAGSGGGESARKGGKGDGGGGGAAGPRPGGGKGSATKPIPVPAQLQEAPALAKMVKSGDLPAVQERLPKEPYVVPHNWLEPGKYGGRITMLTPATDDGSNLEFTYGHAPLRWLNDGIDLTSGLLDSWESNDDATEFTLHLREGVKWSDGEPLTSADAMYWWQDMVLNPEDPAIAPDSGRGSTGNPMKLSAPDDLTLVATLDAPTPTFPYQLARYVHNDDWFQPKHYLQQFHPKYNKQITAKDWANTHADKMNFLVNPECPTLTGWRVKSYKEGREVTWERNPYYWCVDREGNQLPYADTVTMTVVQDPEVAKLQIQQGQVDYVHGGFIPLVLADFSGLKQTQARSHMRMTLWNSGSGSGSIFFFNLDYPEPAMRKLINNAKFRQALSYAFDRREAQKSIYYDTGEPTTGTYSPQAIEYQVEPEGPKMYRAWRDSYVEYDPEKAKKLLDDLGVVDADGDGFRELPGGEKLVVRIDYPADTSDDHLHKNNLLERDWKKIGVNTKQNPVSPTAYPTEWAAGKLMSNGAWEASTVHDHLILAYWLTSTRETVWAPLQGQWWLMQGDPKLKEQDDRSPWDRTPPRLEPEPGSPVARLWDGLRRATAESDGMRRNRIVWDMLKIHIDEGPFYQGSVANYPQAVLAHEDMRNVPTGDQLHLGGLVNTWSHPTPAVYDPEAYFWTNPEEHT